ncbi:helix-turn-helix domain-containing protein [Methylobacter sp. G7]|uniref:helix-turn-helix domain-containing protein n=1 Tax=Methylobacter sp. G7 TaxID=3230117 RepID=UPI003D801175
MKKTIRKAFKFQLKATPAVSQQLANFAGGSRFVWNKGLALNLDRLEQKAPLLWYQELNFWATLWK